MKRIAMVLFLTVGAAGSAHAVVPYPAGTTVGQAFMALPRIPPERALELLTNRMLAPISEEGVDIFAGEVEALKYLLANRGEAVEEPSAPDTRTFVGQISVDTATEEQRGFLQDLLASLLGRILPPQAAQQAAALTSAGSPSTSASDPICVRQVPKLLEVKYKLKFHLLRLDVYGLAVFGVNVQYGLNHSDLIYGLFPFGYSIGYWDGLRCVLENGVPSSQEDLRACGHEKHWQVQANSKLDFTMVFNHEVPGVAAGSLPYLGSLLTNQVGQFQSHNRAALDPDQSYLLGFANVPLPTKTSTFLQSNASGIHYAYKYDMLVSGYPTLILFSGFNNLLKSGGATIDFTGAGEGNPHSIGAFQVHRNLSLFHGPFPACN